MNIGDGFLPEYRESRVGRAHIDNLDYCPDENPDVPEVFVLEVHFEYKNWQECVGYIGSKPYYERFEETTVTEMLIDGQHVDETDLSYMVGPNSARNAIAQATTV